MGHWINWPVLDSHTGRVLAQEVVPFPIVRGSDWSRSKTTAAIRTDIAQYVIDTRRAKSAFVAADACCERVGWQRCVAMFARRSEFKHSDS